MEKFLTHYRQVLRTVNWQLRSLPLYEHGLLAGGLVALTVLMLLFSRLVVVLVQAGGLILLPCALYVACTFLARNEHKDDVDYE